MTENCIFCKIIQKEAPANLIYEDEWVVAFLSNRPVNEGHTLVVPKKHYVNIYGISEDEAAYLFKIAKASNSRGPSFWCCPFRWTLISLMVLFWRAKLPGVSERTASGAMER